MSVRSRRRCRTAERRLFFVGNPLLDGKASSTQHRRPKGGRRPCGTVTDGPVASGQRDEPRWARVGTRGVGQQDLTTPDRPVAPVAGAIEDETATSRRSQAMFGDQGNDMGVVVLDSTDLGALETVDRSAGPGCD